MNVRPLVFVVAVAIAWAVVVLIYRQKLKNAGLTITSWFRGPWKNERIGGVSNSRHQLGLAFDVVPVNDATFAKVRAMGFKKVLRESDHIHIEIV